MAMSYASAMVGPKGNITSSHNVESCKRQSVGNYMVTYKNGFNSSPGVVVTQWSGPGSCGVNVDATNVCQVFTFDKQGNAVDAGFSFLAVGEA